MKSDRPNRVLLRNFKDKNYQLEDLYQVYHDAYNIPIIKLEIKLEDEYSFAYCKDRKYIALLLPFGKNKDLLLNETFLKNKVKWLPIAGSVRNDLHEDFMEAAMRLAKTTYPEIELGELEPLAILENVFKFQDKECIHKGVAFISRIRNNDPYDDIYKDKAIRCQLIRYSLINHKNFDDTDATQWDKLMCLAKTYLENKDLHSVQENEISGYVAKKSRYLIHNATTKPAMKFFGKYFFKHSITDLNRRIEELILEENPTKFLDVACGDNDLVIKISQKHEFDLAVGNDLSWSQLQDLRNSIDIETFKNSKSLVIFSNHDAKKLPFKDQYFDVLLCKNVLHHMDNLENLKSLVNEMNRVSKKVIIVEVMNPKDEGNWGRFRHRWVYDKLLKEVEAGDNFLSREAFNEISQLNNGSILPEMRTIRSVYQFCIFKN